MDVINWYQSIWLRSNGIVVKKEWIYVNAHEISISGRYVPDEG
jgi:hypothetical protein